MTIQLAAYSMIIHTSKKTHKQPFRGVLRKRCSGNRQQIYRRTPMPECDFNEVALQLCTSFTSYKNSVISKIQSGGIPGRLLGESIKDGYALMKYVITPLVKSVLIPIRLTTAD